jgi:hypothetical protein
MDKSRSPIVLPVLRSTGRDSAMINAQGQRCKIVPEVATEEMWGGVARDLVFWMDTSGGRPTGKTLRFHFKSAVGELPEWLAEEIPDEDHVPSKGTRAAVIHKACVDAAPAFEPHDSVVERVAREICKKHGDESDLWRHYEPYARAAISAFVKE